MRFAREILRRNGLPLAFGSRAPEGLRALNTRFSSPFLQGTQRWLATDSQESAPKTRRSKKTADSETEGPKKEKAKKSKVKKTEEQPSITATTGETIHGSSTEMSFQAETKRLLEIVAKSLYTDKEIFIRELISNASDACEKARYLQDTNQLVIEGDKPFQIEISTDPERSLLIIQDSGIGMTREELIQNLGTIAHSGSKAFLNQLESGASSMDNIIGQFGVGFYSVFMVSDKVEVFSKSAKGGSGHYWCSDGSGSFSIAEADGIQRGTKIVLHLKEDSKQFAKDRSIKRVAKKHSNFVGFPVFVEGEELKSLGALWMKSKDDVTDEEHTEFFRFLTNTRQQPNFRLHFHTDVPLAIHALFYFPESHLEKWGLGRMEPGVSLYSRKVLIQANSPNILPSWLRFLKGVVDSEDIPLNISRENMQDSQLITRIRTALTRKVLSFLTEIAEKEPVKYKSFYRDFGNFIREGVATDYSNKNLIARLIRFETSVENDNLVSFDQYISKMPVTQKNIYYINAPSRLHADASPYMEAFKREGIEVFYVYSQADDMVMESLKEYEGRKIISVDSSSAEVNSKAKVNSFEAIDRAKELSAWMKSNMSNLIQSVKPSERILNVPAIIVNDEVSALRRMQIIMEMQGEEFQLPSQDIEINPDHPVITGLYKLKDQNPELAKEIAAQLVDNAVIHAGLMRDGRHMVKRMDSILHNLVEKSLESAEPLEREAVILDEKVTSE